MSVRAKRLLVCVSAYLFWFSQYIYNPHMTPFLLSLGISATFAGIIVGAYGFTQLVARFPLGVSADHLQKHRIFIILGLFFSAFASLLRFFFPVPAVLLIASLLSGIASSMWISFTILYSCYFDRSELSKALSQLLAVNNAGTLSAFLVGGLLVETMGMQALFLISLVVALVGMVIALFIKDEPVNAPPLPVKELLKTAKDKRLILFSSLAVLFQIVIFATANSFTSTVVKGLGASGFQVSVNSALFMTASMVGAWFIGTPVARKIGEKRIMLIGFCVLAAYAFLVPRMPNVYAIMALQFMGGLGNSSLMSLMMSNAIRDIPNERRTTGMGFYQSVYAIGITLGPMIMGTLVDWSGYIIAYSLIALVALLCVGFTLLIKKD